MSTDLKNIIKQFTTDKQMKDLAKNQIRLEIIMKKIQAKNFKKMCKQAIENGNNTILLWNIWSYNDYYIIKNNITKIQKILPEPLIIKKIDNYSVWGIPDLYATWPIL